MTSKAEKLGERLKKISASKFRFALLALSGVLTGLSLVFPVAGFFEWITLVPMGMVLLTRASDKNTRLWPLYLDGLSFFYPFYLVCFHWFVNLYPLEFIEGMTKLGALAVVCAGVFGLSLLQAAMGGLLFLVCGLLFQCRIFERLAFLKPVFISLCYSVYEWTQTLGWWGVPWGRLPIGQTKYIAGIQTASLLGSYFVTFTIVLVNMLLAFALLNITKAKAARAFSLGAVGVLLLNYAVGGVLFFSNDTNEGKTLRVACVQGNFNSNSKWNAEIEEIVKVYSDYTKQAAEQGAELVVYPETAFPSDLEYFEPFCRDIAKDNSVYLLVGTFTYNDEGRSMNSLVCFTPDGEMCETVYSKRRLVPFGEYIPMQKVIETLIPPLAQLEMSDNDIGEGKGSQIIEIKNKKGESIKLGGLICFDSIYEELVYQSTVDGAELFCLGTNDSWFTDSAALYMHNAQAQLRAAESGRYVARAANTGISTVINSRGEVLEQLEPLVGGIVVRDVTAKETRTLWSYVGNSFVYASALLTAGVFLEEIIHRFAKKSKI